MSMNTTLIVILGIGLIALAGRAEPVATNVASLLSNGDFETGRNGDGVPVGWLKENTTIACCVAEDGNHFLRLHTTEPGKMVMLYRAVALPADVKALELTFRARWQDIKAGKESWFDGRIMLNFKDADQKVLKPAPPPPTFRGSQQEWQTRNLTFLVPEGARTLELMPALFQAASGTLDFDDVRLIPISPDLVQAQTVARAAKVRAKVRREPGQNLMDNGDFERIKDGVPVGWLKANGENTSCQVEEGNHFLRLHLTEPGKMVQVYRTIPLAEDDKALELSFRVRTEGIKVGAQPWYDGRIMMNFIGADKKKLPGAPAPYFRGTSKDWRTVTNRFVVPEGAVTLEFMPSLFMAAAGTLDLDDLRLTSLGAADAEAMAAAKAAVAKQAAERAALVAKDAALPPITPEIKVSSNRFVTVSGGKEVWLQGLSCDSMQWGPGENIPWSIRVALNEWHANAIRLAVKDSFWFGRPEGHESGGSADAYRETVDQAVKLCAARGAWLILDLHRFGAPKPEHVEFWKDAAARYKNNPAVLFELFNEPHGISWPVWRNGGNLKGPENTNTDVNVVENKEKTAGEISTGMQALVDAVRSTGASNVVLAGGLDWSYNLSGVLNGYALNDSSGNGIGYVWHNYPWKSGWQANGLVVAEQYPIILTEVGNIRKWEDFSFIGEKERRPLEGWPEDMLGCKQKYRLNWTGFSFHPRCGPMVISDWDYTPTPYWGAYVKDALAGKTFEMKKMR